MKTTRTVLLLLVVMLAACPPASPPSVPPGVDQPGASPDDRPPPPPPPVITVFDAGLSGEEALAAVGAPCDDATACESGVCEGLGCGELEGTCAPAARACTRDLATYCGCDGTTFRGSGSCPGQRYAYRGECAAPRADGQACESGDQCASGLCEGQGCDRAALGICVPPGRMCTADVVAFCDCRGRAFQASSSCPGRRYRARGDCSE